PATDLSASRKGTRFRLRRPARSTSSRRCPGLRAAAETPFTIASAACSARLGDRSMPRIGGTMDCSRLTIWLLVGGFCIQLAQPSQLARQMGERLKNKKALVYGFDTIVVSAGAGGRTPIVDTDP